MYRKSLANLEAAKSSNTLADTFVQSIETAPAETKTIREKLGKSANQPPGEEVDVPDAAAIKDIDQLLLKAKANFTAIEARAASLASQIAALIERPANINKRLAEVKNNEEELVAALKASPSTEESPQVKDAADAAPRIAQ